MRTGATARCRAGRSGSSAGGGAWAARPVALVVTLAVLATLAPFATPAVPAPFVTAPPPRLAEVPEVLSASPAFAPGGLANGSGWLNLTPSEKSPVPATASGAMVYDPSASADLLIPGTLSRGCMLLYTNADWQCVHTTPYFDGAVGLSLAWDNQTQSVIAFGGLDPVTNTTGNATYQYHAGVWADLTAGPAPSPRWGAGLAWDAADGWLVLFGGTNGSATFNDTWAFNGTGWALLHPTTPPPARFGAAFVPASTAGALVLFGGNGTGGVPLNDTWIFDQGSWSEGATAVAPSPRFDTFAAYDAALGSDVLFGGTNGVGSLQDLWTFGAGAWSGPYPLTFPMPSGRAMGEMAPAPTGNGLLLVGGRSGPTTLNDTWLFYTVSPQVRAQPTEGEGPIVVNFTSASAGGIPPLTFAWTFGDGGAFYGPNVTHAYSSPGRYAVNLTVTDAGGVQGHYHLTIADVAPLALEATLTPAVGPSPVHVAGTATLLYGAPPYSITWRFAGGPTLSGTRVAFTYTQPGTYSVATWCNDSFGRSVEQAFTVDVLTGEPAPQLNVSLLANRTVAAAPAAIGFVAGATGPVPLLGFTWLFGDGTGASGTTATHVYASPGSYTVGVTVLGADGTTATTSRSLVIGPPFVVSVADSVTTGTTGDVVQLNASGSGGFPPYQFYWQFNNGTAAAGANVTGFSPQAGTLPVQLEAVDALGDVARRTYEIPVPGPTGGGPSSPVILGPSLVTGAVLGAAAGLGGLLGGGIAARALPARRAPSVTPRRSGRAPRGPPPRVRRPPPAAGGPTAPRSPPGRTGAGRRPPPPSG